MHFHNPQVPPHINLNMILLQHDYTNNVDSEDPILLLDYNF